MATINDESAKEEATLDKNRKTISGNDSLKSFSVISFLGIGLCILLLVILWIIDLEHIRTNIIGDLRNILVAVMTGLIFSFLLSISSVRAYLLGTVSNFLTDNYYLKRLNSDQLKQLKKDVAKHLHHTDSVEDDESLYKYISNFEEEVVSRPHKSMTSETWHYTHVSGCANALMFKRIQYYRIHSHNFKVEKFYNLAVAHTCNANDIEFKDFKSNVKISYTIGSNKINVPESEIVFHNETSNGKNNFSFKFEKQIELTGEYTPVCVELEAITGNTTSDAILSSCASYGIVYNITLPDDMEFIDVYTSYNLRLFNSDIDRRIDKNALSFHVNGWQMSGLVCVYTMRYKMCSVSCQNLLNFKANDTIISNIPNKGEVQNGGG